MTSPRNTNGSFRMYDDEGNLIRSWFAEDAWELLEQTKSWLEEIERPLFLPIDLIVVLLRRGHVELRSIIARVSRGADEFEELQDHLEALARRIDRDGDDGPRLRMSNFSLGFVGILEDAATWCREAGWDRIAERDLARVSRWRAEIQESASVRWAVRQLAQPGGDEIFDLEGKLLRSPFEREVWNALQDAMTMAASSGMPFLGTPHLVASLCNIPGGVLREAAVRSGVDGAKLRDELLRIVGTRDPAQPEFVLSRRTLTPRLVRMLIAAYERAGLGNQSRDVTEHDLLEAFLDDGGSSLELVRAMGVVSRLRDMLGNAQVRQKHAQSRGEIVEASGPSSSSTPTLDLLGRNLTDEAREGNLPNVLGRDEELQRIINVLLRSEQRNPLLTGEAGVGKTALAAGLAQRIAEGSVPKNLKGLRVVEINGANLIGGTSYRGDLEARIKTLLAEAEDDVILFMDEAHAIFAPRSSSGQPAEVPNHFKSALASGRIAVVAATTEAEYHRWIEQDPALKRRFERIEIRELSPDITRQILRGLVDRFEEDYEVTLTPDAVDAAIEMSVRFIPEQSLPDKAKKLLMDSAIAVSSELALARAAGQNTPDDRHDTPSKRVVHRVDVAKQVALKTGVPLDRVARGQVSWWRGLEERLAGKLVGQPQAVRSVARRLVAGRLSAAGSNRPQAVFMFAGPPGVGKGQLARILAGEVFGSERALIRLDMGDYHEAHSLARLIGTPPGYVGYQDEDALVTPLRRRPSSVVLLEDFNLAHPRVQERIARLFEEGEITDTRGLRADASHAIFVMTIDAELSGRGAIGFGSDRAESAATSIKDIDAGLAERLRGYSCELVLFRGVADGGHDLALQLLEARMEQFRASLEDEYGIELVLSSEVERTLRERVLGVRDAREIDELMRELVIERATDVLLSGEVTDVLRIGDDEVEAPSTLEPQKV